MYETAIEDQLPKDAIASEYCMSIDYGTENPFAAYIYGKYGNTWYCIDEYYYNGHESSRTKTDSEYADELEAFTEPYRENRKLEVIIDPSAASFKAELKRRKLYRVRDADNAVQDGIRETATCLQKGYLKVLSKCKNMILEFSGYVWDEKSADEKPVKVNDHYMDATRYFVYTKGIAKVKRHYNSIFEQYANIG
jgi:PBSX family phage terminase large subunit